MIDRRWLALLLVAWLAPAAAADFPLWEAGIGMGGVFFPDYRGSDEGRTYWLPVPYFVYRGDRLRVDRRGVRGELFGIARARLELSAGLGPPARSEPGGARAGMPDLDPTVELGPLVDIELFEGPRGNRRLSLRLPVRGVVATDLSHYDHIGWVFAPHLAYEMAATRAGGGWNLGLSAGPIYASNEYHDYYYAVRPGFDAPTRPAFDARSGYSGASIGITLSRRYAGYWVGAFVRYDDLDGAVFEDSPLVRTKQAVVAGIAVSKIVAQSRERVTGRDIDF